MHAWKNKAIVDNFLINTRNAIPCGGVQLDILLRLISKSQSGVSNFIDLGCGDGILSHTVLTQYPDANGLLIDYSPSMIEAAKKRLSIYKNLDMVLADLSNNCWISNVKDKPDVVGSGFAIHHLKNGRKYELFEEIYKVLKPGGIFINMEHVKSESAFGNALFDEIMIDTLYEKLRQEGKEKDKTELMKEHLIRPDQYDNVLVSVTTQCDWLREIGFVDVDCYFKCFELSIYAGVKRLTSA